MPGKCSFNPLWLNETGGLTNKWLSPVADDKFKGYCKFCKSKFDVSHSGIASLKLHANGKKHKNFVDALLKGSQTTLNFKTPAEEAQKELEDIHSSSSSENVSLGANPKNHQPSGLIKYLMKNEVAKAEIILALFAVQNHISYRTGGNLCDMLKMVLPDSTVIEHINMHKDKFAYVVTYGLGPYFQNQLTKKISKSEFFCLSLDESLNKVSQNGQMDIIVRFWDDINNKVSTRYLTSAFLERSRAADLLEAFNSSISELGLPPSKIVQIETDGPNVNLKFLRDFEEHKKSFSDEKILDIGTCSLHVLHNCYKTAHKNIGWKINDFLRASYYLFKDFPSRRADYKHFSNCNIFPLKLCSIRWVENSRVIERAIKILPSLKLYVEGVKKNPPATKNFETVSDFLQDELLLAKLYFLHSIASDLELFLVQFQSDKPLLPFLYTELSMLIRSIGLRCMKKDVCCPKNLRMLLSIDVENANNLIDLRHVDVGFGAKGLLSSMSEKKKLDFLRESRKFLIVLFDKMRLKSPLHKILVKGASCFCPDIMLDESIRSSRISLALKAFIESKQISPIEADNIKKTYENLCNDPKIKARLKTFCQKTDQLDSFLFDITTSCRVDDHFLLFLKKILTMFHGNASVERGFSINKECIVDNLLNHSLVAQRAVHSAILSCGGISAVAITPDMMSYVCSASSRRQEALKEKKKLGDIQILNQKKLAADLKELKKRKIEVIQEAEEKVEELKKKIAATERELNL